MSIRAGVWLFAATERSTEYCVKRSALRVGTSGWFYDWNPERTLDWYVAESGLNAVELNASFYRFPFPNQVRSWALKGRGLRWAVKASKLVTHTRRFGGDALAVWQRFRALLEPLDRFVDCYLLQLHPQLDPESSGRIGEFAVATGLGKRFALECRHRDWFSRETAVWAEKLGITLVSVDAPSLPREIYNTSGLVYLRMHGRAGWYRHDYAGRELREVAARIRAAKPESAGVFFNNDEHMLGNARRMLGLLTGR